MTTLCILLATFQLLICSSAAYYQDDPTFEAKELHPVALDQVNGTVANASSLASDNPGSAIFTGPSSATYSFGSVITGNITLTIGDVDPDQYIGVHVTASNVSSNDQGCAETTAKVINATFWFFVTGPGTFTVQSQREQGRFQHLSLLHNTTGAIQVQQITVQ